MDRTVANWTIMILGPLLVVASYSLLSRWTSRWFSVTSDHVALGIAVAVGLWSISRLHTTKTNRVLLALLYVPVMAAALVFLSLALVCTAFGDCL